MCNEVYVALRKMKDDGYDMTQPKKRLAEEVAKRSSKKLGEPRTIRGHVSKWLRDKELAKTGFPMARTGFSYFLLIAQ